ncbi:hypothetical protein BgiMline_029933, partial [Biomphalaria glabrata]
FQGVYCSSCNTFKVTCSTKEFSELQIDKILILSLRYRDNHMIASLSINSQKTYT